MLSLIFTIFCFITLYTVNGRTCTCAQFIEDSCDAQENCEWNTRETIGDIAKNVKGVCRSNQWMACHKDEACSILGRREIAIERSLEAEEEAAEAAGAQSNNKRRLSSDDIGSEGNLDWPYNCISNEYHDDALILDVTPYQRLAFKAAGFDTIEDTVGIAKYNEFNMLSFGVMVKFAIIITFCCLITYAVCYKFKDPARYKAINHEQDTYATF